MPQRSPTVALSEPTSLRRSPRLLQLEMNNPRTQDSTTPKPRFRSSGALPHLYSTPQISSTPRCSLSELPIICALKASDVSDSASGSCRRSRNESKKGSDLSCGVVGIQGVRRSPRFLNRINCAELVGKACKENSIESVFGGFDGGHVLSEMGNVPFELGICSEHVGEMNKRVLRSSVDYQVTPVEHGMRKAIDFEVDNVMVSGKGSYKYANGGWRKRSKHSSLADSGVESDKSDVSKSEISQCSAVSLGVKSTREKISNMGRTCSTNEVAAVPETLALRRSPRLLDRINSQKPESKACDVKSYRPISCGLSSRWVSLKKGKALEEKLLVDIDGEKKQGIDACKSLHSAETRREKHGNVANLANKPEENNKKGKGGKEKQGNDKARREKHGNVANLANEPEGNNKKVSGGKEEQGNDKAFCVSTHPYATPTGKVNMQKTAKELNVVGDKRKQKRVVGIDHGWTKDQVLALQGAYFATKPTPHFWKKVAKAVPGKSAQDCYDKINSENPTPPLHQPRPRAKRRISSPSPHFSYSPCRIFRFLEPKNKRVRNGNRKSHIAQRTARHMLEKFSQVCQGNGGDFFSVLEPNVNPSDQVVQQASSLLTPIRVMNPESSPMWGQRPSSSCNKKCLSRFSSSCGTTVISPPVLKPVKSRALHEKYIDHLHCREAKRMATSARNVKSSSIEYMKKERCLGNTDIIRAAKSALVSDARDAISRFQHLQVDLTENYPDFEEEEDA